MSAKQNVIAQALELNEAERLEVAEALFESIEGPPDPGAAEAWDKEIRLRMEKVRSGGGKFIPWNEARRRIAGDDDASAPR